MGMRPPRRRCSPRSASGRGQEPLGVVKTLLYRPELFGTPFSEELHEVMRGPSDWSPGERELFAAFTSLLNQCPF